MLTHIFATRYVRQRRSHVNVSQLQDFLPVCFYMPGNSIKTPRPAEVQAIEVHKSAIGAVFNTPGLQINRRLKQ